MSSDNRISECAAALKLLYQSVGIPFLIVHHLKGFLFSCPDDLRGLLIPKKEFIYPKDTLKDSEHPEGITLIEEGELISSAVCRLDEECFAVTTPVEQRPVRHNIPLPFKLMSITVPGRERELIDLIRQSPPAGLNRLAGYMGMIKFLYTGELSRDINFYHVVPASGDIQTSGDKISLNISEHQRMLMSEGEPKSQRGRDQFRGRFFRGICDAVRRGDEAMLSEALLQPQNTLLYITGDPLQDARYQTVCELQGAADAAVQGGLSAFEASELTQIWCQSAVHIGRESELERFRRECLVQLCRKTAKAAGQRRFSVHVRSAIDYIEGHSDSVLTTEEIASAVGLSASRLSAVFRKESGESVHQFVIRKKLARAALLLRETTVSIPEIAGLLHFSDQSHLTRLFRRQYSVTPYRYRLKEDSTEMN